MIRRFASLIVFTMLSAGILTLCTSGMGAQTLPIAFDDFLGIQRVSDPQLSPDGNWIVFVLTVMNKAENRGTSNIWIVSTEGGPTPEVDHGA